MVHHAYGLAVDVNPRENPYVGCGQSHDPTAQSYRDRPGIGGGWSAAGRVRAFAHGGWGWGGSWSGNTKDYMHFSTTVTGSGGITAARGRPRRP